MTKYVFAPGSEALQVDDELELTRAVEGLISDGYSLSLIRVVEEDQCQQVTLTLKGKSDE